MKLPPKAKRAPAKSALELIELRLEYWLLDFLQVPFAYVFWLIEQRKSRLNDRLENVRSTR